MWRETQKQYHAKETRQQRQGQEPKQGNQVELSVINAVESLTRKLPSMLI